MSPSGRQNARSMPMLRTVLAVVALLAQLVLGPRPAEAHLAADALARLQAVAVLCHAPRDGAAPSAPHRRHAPDDGAGGALDLALELPAAVLPPAVPLPRPPVPAAAPSFRLPAARAPPVPVAVRPPARAPPRLA